MSTHVVVTTAAIPLGIEIKEAQNLTAKTVFLKVRFGSLGNSRKVAGQENVLETDADKALLRVSKTLLDSKELEAIKKATGKMRQYLYGKCLPFDVGTLLLPVGLIETVHNKLTEFRAEWQALVSAFVVAYPALCETASKRLGSLYNPFDYPPADAIAARFAFDWQYVSLGVPGHLKGVSSAIYDQETKKAAEQLQNAAEEIKGLMRQTLHELVAHLAERLKPGSDGKVKKLHETAVTHLQEFLSTFEHKNVTEDSELAAIVSKTKALIAGTSAESLRSSEVFRLKVADSMMGISAALAGMVETKPGRKYRTN